MGPASTSTTSQPRVRSSTAAAAPNTPAPITTARTYTSGRPAGRDRIPGQRAVQIANNRHLLRLLISQGARTPPPEGLSILHISIVQVVRRTSSTRRTKHPAVLCNSQPPAPGPSSRDPLSVDAQQVTSPYGAPPAAHPQRVPLRWTAPLRLEPLRFGRMFLSFGRCDESTSPEGAPSGRLAHAALRRWGLWYFATTLPADRGPIHPSHPLRSLEARPTTTLSEPA